MAEQHPIPTFPEVFRDDFEALFELAEHSNVGWNPRNEREVQRIEDAKAAALVKLCAKVAKDGCLPCEASNLFAYWRTMALNECRTSYLRERDAMVNTPMDDEVLAQQPALGQPDDELPLGTEHLHLMERVGLTSTSFLHARREREQVIKLLGAVLVDQTWPVRDLSTLAPDTLHLRLQAVPLGEAALAGVAKRVAGRTSPAICENVPKIATAVLYAIASGRCDRDALLDGLGRTMPLPKHDPSNPKEVKKAVDARHQHCTRVANDLLGAAVAA